MYGEPENCTKKVDGVNFIVDFGRYEFKCVGKRVWKLDKKRVKKMYS